jgi:DNA polymerase-1
MLGRPDERDFCKNLNFGLAYGMGVELLALSLGITVQEAKVLLNLYHKRAPFIHGLRDATSNRAEASGHIHTILGRRCRFPLWEPRRYGDGREQPLPFEQACKTWGRRNVRRAGLHKAMNRVIQGGGADITKAAMAACYDAGYYPLLQVHDELNFNTSDPLDEGNIVEIMEDTTTTNPAMSVEVGIGDNWAEAH